MATMNQYRTLFEMMGCAVGVLVLACLTGCGSGADPANNAIKASNPSNIHRLTNLYSAFATQHGGSGPADEGEFRDFIVSLGPERLGRMGIDPNAIEGIFKSERDSQPFIIRYGRKSADAAPSGMPTQYGGVVVIEATGASGTRQAGIIGTREVKSLDASEAAAIK